MKKTKGIVRLRNKLLATGQRSLYLDIYLNGHRSYEFLHLYLIPEHGKADREKNNATIKIAEVVAARREVELAGEQYGVGTGKLDIPLLLYAEKLAETSRNAYIVLPHLKDYIGQSKVTLRGVTPVWVRMFRSYLDSLPLAQGTKVVYWSGLNVIFNRAVKDGILTRNPARGAEQFRKEQAERMYLTIEELRAFAEQPARNDKVKRAFLFSCLTGLRYSDVRSITWGDVYTDGEYTRLVFRQRKTKGLEYLDLNPQAVELMGERQESAVLIFPIGNNSNVNGIVGRIAERAGIKKHITFHCARHTFATMMLSLGTEIYTVSKLLGHQSIATTQIYARVIDKAKREAVMRIPSVLTGEHIPDTSQEP